MYIYIYTDVDIDMYIDDTCSDDCHPLKFSGISDDLRNDLAPRPFGDRLHKLDVFVLNGSGISWVWV